LGIKPMMERRKLIAWPFLPYALLLGSAIVAPASAVTAMTFVFLFAFPGAALWCFIGLVLAFRAQPMNRAAIGINALLGALAVAPFFLFLSGIWQFHI
jgi:hypothetical protein